MDDRAGYPLGYSEEEAQRLIAQAAFFRDLTRDVLCRAGLTAGMRVLDLGCGVGDVSLLAAELVGHSGSVLGIDRSAASVAIAERRCAALGLGNVRFAVSELDALDPDETFDAITGRFVLLYYPDRIALLRRLSARVRPGGVVAFQEMDMSTPVAVPASALFDRVGEWIRASFRSVGVETEMGSRLVSTYLDAGLPRPTVVAASRVESGPDSPAYDYMAGILRAILPMTEKSGVASVAEIDIDTLGARLRQEALSGESVVFLPRLVGAWSRLT